MAKEKKPEKKASAGRPSAWGRFVQIVRSEQARFVTGLILLMLSAIVGLVLRWDIFWVYAVQALEQAVKVAAGWWRLRSGKWVRDVTVSDRARA